MSVFVFLSVFVFVFLSVFVFVILYIPVIDCTSVLHRWLFADMCVLALPSVIMDKGHCARSLELAFRRPIPELANICVDLH